ncbi:MAG: hypothetical protein FWF84_08050 [Kiritimatiellaeota bacterium]|nr:hypothetical protein [Kiritimatiellota bacterium]
MAEQLAVASDVAPSRSLPRLFTVDSVSEAGGRVRRSEGGQFEAMVRQKTYPFGSVVEVKQGGSAGVTLAPSVRMEVKGASQVTIHGNADEGTPYRVGIGSGEAVVTAPKDGGLSLCVESAAGRVENILGKVDILAKSYPDAHRMGVAVVDGTAAVVGGQFKIPEMKRNMVVDVETTHDNSYTLLSVRSGAVDVLADRGTDPEQAVRLRVGETLAISRTAIKGGDRQAISVVVAGSEGIMLQYTYVEGSAATVTISKSPAPKGDGATSETKAGEAERGAADDFPAAGTEASDAPFSMDGDGWGEFSF